MTKREREDQARLMADLNEAIARLDGRLPDPHSQRDRDAYAVILGVARGYRDVLGSRL